MASFILCKRHSMMTIKWWASLHIYRNVTWKGWMIDPELWTGSLWTDVLWLECNKIGQGFSTRDDFASRGHLKISGEIFDCHSMGSVATNLACLGWPRDSASVTRSQSLMLPCVLRLWSGVRARCVLLLPEPTPPTSDLTLGSQTSLQVSLFPHDRKWTFKAFVPFSVNWRKPI